MNKKEQVKQGNLPRHVAVIMDGNGRWARKNGMKRVLGHKNGVNAVKETTEIAAELGVEYLTLYAFSTENWNRPENEVNALMSLLIETVKNELHTLQENDIKLDLIGDISRLPQKSREALQYGIEETEDNRQMTLILALNYSARWEITNAAKSIATDTAADKITPDEVNESQFNNYLCTRDIPDPELMIRTSGEKRISNFLLWQLAYTELYFTSTLWPDFNEEGFLDAILDFQSRERRFGKTSDQLHKE